MQEPKTWRESPFVRGTNYLVIKDFIALRCSFKKDELLCFEKDVYSIYDSCTGYVFKSASGDQTFVWDLYDDDDLSVWTDFFKLA